MALSLLKNLFTNPRKPKNPSSSLVLARKIVLQIAAAIPLTACAPGSSPEDQFENEVLSATNPQEAAEALQRLELTGIISELLHSEFLFVLTGEHNGPEVLAAYGLPAHKKSAQKLTEKIQIAARELEDQQPENEEGRRQILEENGFQITGRNEGVEVKWFEEEDIIIVKMTYIHNPDITTQILNLTIIDEPITTVKNTLIASGVGMEIIETLFGGEMPRYGTTSDIQLLVNGDENITRFVLRHKENYFGPDEARERPLVYTAVSDFELSGPFDPFEKLLTSITYRIAGQEVTVVRPSATAREFALEQAFEFGLFTATEFANTIGNITPIENLQMGSWTF